ncbi:MAG: hypothetical protein JKY94_12230 [Rhodobacteraceae bacterium]|nr:hypothetical protein [Paracoccaceae bacterium]
MKTYLILLSLALISACDGGSTGEVADAPTEAAATSSSVATPAVLEAIKPKLPFDMPIMDGARYISGSPVFSKPSKRRGGEAIATIAVKGTPLDIVEYYEKALAERGFTPELGRHNDGAIASVHGINDKRERFSVSAIRGGSKARQGESTAALVATLPK